MKISILAETRAPTRNVGGSGAGRMSWDIASGLRARGHDVTLYAGLNSDAPDGVTLYTDASERTRAQDLAAGFDADAVLDMTHDHWLSRHCPDAPVCNWCVDTEFDGILINGIVGNAWQHAQFPSARIVPLGIDVDAYPFVAEPDDFVLFAAKLHINKGYDYALAAAWGSGKRFVMIGENMAGHEMPPNIEYMPEIADNARFLAYLSRASVLLAPYRNDAGGRVLLEAAGCGTPVIALSGTGTAYHVMHGVSGLVCATPDDLVTAIRDSARIERAGCRQWVKDSHDLPMMLDGVEAALLAVANGLRW
jgi:glycosyltransferase involved in cell wall biosynthesis